MKKICGGAKICQNVLLAYLQDQKMKTLKNPLLKTVLPINVAQSPNIKGKSQVDATKTFLIGEKHCFEKNAFKVGE